MAENQGICSKASWVAPTGEKDLPLSRGPFIFGCVAVGDGQSAGWSCSELFSKEWFRPCVAGDEGSNPRYDDLGPVL